MKSKYASKYKFKIGDKIRSNYRSRFQGIIIDIEKWDNTSGYICVVIPILTSDGRKQRKRMVKSYDPYWLEPCDFNDDLINQDWLKVAR